MNIASCLNPKLIRHPYTHEQMYVPCGHCAACLRARSQRWVQRLIQERYSWKYCAFFTLTYDSEHLPLLKFVNGFIPSNGFVPSYGFLYDVHHRLTPPEQDVFSLDISECIYKYSKDYSRDTDWLSRISGSFGGVPVLSSYDLQKFLKRFRINTLRTYERTTKQFSTYVEKQKPCFRYFVIGEYGETCLRPHYHGLFFFNSEFLASHFKELLDSSWKYGISDFSLVSENNSSYVASYLNCTAHLPSIYRDRKTRPFFLCSKFPPLGTMCHSSEEIRKIFFSATPEQVIFDHSKGLFANVPLWRTYIDRLYPRLSSFSEISHTDRVSLYGLVQRKSLSNFAKFRAFVLDVNQTSSLIKDYITYLRANCTNFDVALQRWFYISSRVCRQAESFEISIVDYVYQIEKFYENVEKKKLQLQYEWQNDSSENQKQPLIGMDKLYLQSLLDVDVQDISNEDLIILSSYGVDVEKFFSDDENIRINYQTSLLPENTYDYNILSIDSEVWLNRNSKTKKKNEYLELHPLYKNILY